MPRPQQDCGIRRLTLDLALTGRSSVWSRRECTGVWDAGDYLSASICLVERRAYSRVVGRSASTQVGPDAIDGGVSLPPCDGVALIGRVMDCVWVMACVWVSPGVSRSDCIIPCNAFLM